MPPAEHSGAIEDFEEAPLPEDTGEASAESSRPDPSEQLLQAHRVAAQEAAHEARTIVSPDTVARAGMVAVALHLIGIPIGAVISDTCLRQCPTGLFARFWLWLIGYGGFVGQELFPGEGGSHEIVDLAFYGFYLYASALVLVVAYKAALAVIRAVR